MKWQGTHLSHLYRVLSHGLHPPWLATIGLSSRTGWEIALLERKESGHFVVQVPGQVPFMEERLHTCPHTVHPLPAPVEQANPESKAARELLAAHS